jgi:hypothetical protein
MHERLVGRGGDAVGGKLGLVVRGWQRVYADICSQGDHPPLSDRPTGIQLVTESAARWAWYLPGGCLGRQESKVSNFGKRGVACS